MVGDAVPGRAGPSAAGAGDASRPGPSPRRGGCRAPGDRADRARAGLRLGQRRPALPAELRAGGGAGHGRHPEPGRRGARRRRPAPRSCAATAPRPTSCGAAGIERARLVVIADDAPDAAARIAGVVRSLVPRTPLVVRSLAEARPRGPGRGRRRLRRHRRPGLAARAARPACGRSSGWPRARRRAGGTVRGHLAAASTSAPTAARAARTPTWRGRCCRRRRGARTACARAATWVHLRMCVTCGHVGCCDSSPAGTRARTPARRTTR